MVPPNPGEETFEDTFGEAQRDMLQAAYDYVDGRADKLYAYVFCEQGELSFDAFFLIHGRLVKRNKVNDVLRPQEQPHDISTERQFELLHEGCDGAQTIQQACRRFDRPMPVQMKLVYDMEREEFDAEYSYDPANTGPDDYRMGHHFCDIWFDEVAASLG